MYFVEMVEAPGFFFLRMTFQINKSNTGIALYRFSCVE
jgi:hypothetical protein